MPPKKAKKDTEGPSKKQEEADKVVESAFPKIKANAPKKSEKAAAKPATKESEPDTPQQDEPADYVDTLKPKAKKKKAKSEKSAEEEQTPEVETSAKKAPQKKGKKGRGKESNYEEELLRNIEELEHEDAAPKAKKESEEEELTGSEEEDEAGYDSQGVEITYDDDKSEGSIPDADDLEIMECENALAEIAEAERKHNAKVLKNSKGEEIQILKVKEHLEKRIKDKREAKAKAKTEKKGCCSWNRVIVIACIAVLFAAVVALRYGAEDYLMESIGYKDYYGILGVKRGLPDDELWNELRRSYRSLAKKWHPDRNLNCKDCAKKMADISEAYAVLTHRDTRNWYHRYHTVPPPDLMQRAKEKGRGSRDEF